MHVLTYVQYTLYKYIPLQGILSNIKLQFHLFSIIFYHHNFEGQFIMPNDDIMTVKELADYLKIAEKTAYRFGT